MVKESGLVGVIKPGVVRFVTERDIDVVTIAPALAAAGDLAASGG